MSNEYRDSGQQQDRQHRGTAARQDKPAPSRSPEAASKNPRKGDTTRAPAERENELDMRPKQGELF